MKHEKTLLYYCLNANKMKSNIVKMNLTLSTILYMLFFTRIILSWLIWTLLKLLTLLMASLGAFDVTGGTCGNIYANSNQGRKSLIFEALNLNFNFFLQTGTQWNSATNGTSSAFSANALQGRRLRTMSSFEFSISRYPNKWWYQSSMWCYKYWRHSR